jgi:hypothetical protein
MKTTKTKQDKDGREKLPKKEVDKKKLNEYDRIVKFGRDGDFTNDGFAADIDLNNIGE